MKIAIQGHPTRGREIIQILKSLGATSYSTYDTCSHQEWYWYINKNREITCDSKRRICGYKLYTLEEFEKEFPFKVGDLCIYYSDIHDEDIIVKILGMTIKDNCIMYEVGHRDITNKHSYIYRKRETLRPYKEMNTRNVTLTLDKAKEWYKKGGDLKQVALQAFTEEELTKIDLPKTWREFCENYSIQEGEAIIDEQTSEIRKYKGVVARSLVFDKNICPSKKSAEAHLAMIQLEQLRNCWWGDWKPEWKNNVKYAIKREGNNLITFTSINIRAFLVFPTQEMAKEFLECFRYLIEQAGDLI